MKERARRAIGSKLSVAISGQNNRLIDPGLLGIQARSRVPTRAPRSTRFRARGEWRAGCKCDRAMKLSRRSLLKGFAGALAAPALLSLGSLARPRAARAATSGRPRRLLILFTPHGAPAEYFWPKSAADMASQSGDISILAPLQKHAAKLNVLRGINYVGSDNHYANKDVITAKGPDSVDTIIGQ